MFESKPIELTMGNNVEVNVKTDWIHLTFIIVGTITIIIITGIVLFLYLMYFLLQEKAIKV